MKSCELKLTIREGRWIAEIRDPAACTPTVAKMEELGPEARVNLARHLETDDPELNNDIKLLRKRKL